MCASHEMLDALRSELLGPLDQPELVERDSRIDDRARRSLALLFGPPQPRDRACDQAIQVVIHAQRDVPLVDVREQLGQLRIELARRIRGIGAVTLLRTFQPGPTPLPRLHLRIAWPHEHDHAIGLGTGAQHERGVGLDEAG